MLSLIVSFASDDRFGSNTIVTPFAKRLSRHLLTALLVATLDTPLNNFTVYHGGCVENSVLILEVPLIECARECDVHARCVAFVYSKMGCLLKSDTCQFTYSPDAQYLYVKKSFNGKMSTCPSCNCI